MSKLVLSVLATATIASGCGPTPLNSNATFSYDADSLTNSAFEVLDKNKDGWIDRAECASAPSLKASLAIIDTNRDRKISKDELKARFAAFAQKPVAVTVSAIVKKRGQPLTQAEVTLIPESWMGDRKVAIGRTDDRGYVEFKEAGSTVNGIAPGFYRLSTDKSNYGCQVFDDPRTGMPMLTINVP